MGKEAFLASKQKHIHSKETAFQVPSSWRKSDVCSADNLIVVVPLFLILLTLLGLVDISEMA